MNTEVSLKNDYAERFRSAFCFEPRVKRSVEWMADGGRLR